MGIAAAPTEITQHRELQMFVFPIIKKEIPIKAERMDLGLLDFNQTSSEYKGAIFGSDYDDDYAFLRKALEHTPEYKTLMEFSLSLSDLVHYVMTASVTAVSLRYEVDPRSSNIHSVKYAFSRTKSSLKASFYSFMTAKDTSPDKDKEVGESIKDSTMEDIMKLPGEIMEWLQDLLKDLFDLPDIDCDDF